MVSDNPQRDGMVPNIKEKHHNWFKMKIERRELIRQLAPETAVNVLLACWEYLETNEKPKDLSPVENIAFATFIPDMEETWSRYLQRIEARASSRGKPTDTEEEPETKPETEPKKECVAAEPPTRACFVPPTVEEVTAYVQERGSIVDPPRLYRLLCRQRLDDGQDTNERLESGGPAFRGLGPVEEVRGRKQGNRLRLDLPTEHGI